MGETNPPSQVVEAAASAQAMLAAAHARFARAAATIYIGAGVVSLALLAFLLASSLHFQREQVGAMLVLDAEVKAHQLSSHLSLLRRELRRLGLRAEIDLGDKTVAPEQALLSQAHGKSAFFSVGVAILNNSGDVLWSEPQAFVPPGTNLGQQPWFREMSSGGSARLVRTRPGALAQSVLYMASPVIRKGERAGLVLGGIDVARDGALEQDVQPVKEDTMVVATRDGQVVLPAPAPEFTRDPVWPALFAGPQERGFLKETLLGGRDMLVAGEPVRGSDLVLLSVVDTDRLMAPLYQRMYARLGLGLLIVILPLAALIILFARSLKVFRQAEERALRADRLVRLGDAANVIAHEVKNALNTMGLALDMALARNEPSPRAAATLRAEMNRLKDFTTQLLLFSKGVSPKTGALDLGGFASQVMDSYQDSATDAGATLHLIAETGVVVRADATLLHSVVGNLIGNAVDAVAAQEGPGRVLIMVSRKGRVGELRVRDTGAGIAQSVGDRLFEPFVTGKPNGVGLGLALSRQVARAHHGQLVLEEDQDMTTFTLTLPMENP